MIEERLAKAPVVPLVQSEDPAQAVRIAQALIDGGLTVIEVVMRTEAALDCLAAIVEACPDAIAGAGTVLSSAHVSAAAESGAQFIVSPGLSEDVVSACHDRHLPIFPGVMTPSEVQRAISLNLSTVKFFPASLAGGPPMLKAFSSVFKDMRFMPTGGVSETNLTDYLNVASVIACGGSWLTPPQSIGSGDFAEVTRRAEAALKIAAAARSQSASRT